jgi:hypothetical protein
MGWMTGFQVCTFVHLGLVGIFLFVLCCEYVVYLDSVLRGLSLS